MEVTPFELERLLEKKMAERAVQNLIGRFCHLNTARRIRTFWPAGPRRPRPGSNSPGASMTARRA